MRGRIMNFSHLESNRDGKVSCARDATHGGAHAVADGMSVRHRTLRWGGVRSSQAASSIVTCVCECMRE